MFSDRIRAVKAFRRVPFQLKKGRRQVILVQEGSQRTKTDDIDWSSLENADNSNNAFNVNFNNANVNNNNKNNTDRVRAVCAFSGNCNAANMYSSERCSTAAKCVESKKRHKPVFHPWEQAAQILGSCPRRHMTGD